MARENPFDLTLAQRDAWHERAEVLQRALAQHTGALYLEFGIPRMGRRIDALAIIGLVISCWSSRSEAALTRERNA